MTSKPIWKAEDIMRIVHGQCLHEQSWVAHGVSTDSRNVKPGDLFVALKSATHDGHNRVTAAFAAGAVAAIVARQAPAPPHMPLVHVEDSLQALMQLGRVARERSDMSIIAIAGSTGTTGSRDMLRLMLNEVGDTYTTVDRLDHRRDAALALARLSSAALYGVFETGMSLTGELGGISQQMQPDVALIVPGEAAHMDYFGSPEAVIDAKAEIFLGMAPEGVAVLNRDSMQFSRLAAAAKAQGIRKILSFGRDGKADARMLDCIEDADGSDIRAEILGRKIRYRLGMPGIDVATNSLGALLAAVSAGADFNACAAVLAHYRQAQEHDVIQTVALPGGTLTLIDETRDAQPEAVRFAIRVLGQMYPGGNGRRILVLGDMEGAGAGSPSLHVDLAQDIEEVKIAQVFCCGEMTKHLFEALPPALRGCHAPSSEQLIPHVIGAARAGDIVTVKGQRGMGMNAIIDALKDPDTKNLKFHKLAG